MLQRWWSGGGFGADSSIQVCVWGENESVYVCEKVRKRRHPSLAAIFNQTKAEQFFFPPTQMFFCFFFSCFDVGTLIDANKSYLCVD